MRRFKILKIIVTLLLVLTFSSVLLYIIGGEEDSNDEHSELLNQIPPDRKVSMKNPTISWDENTISAEVMEVYKEEDSPGAEKQVFTNFVFTHNTGEDSIKVTGEKALLEKKNPSRPFQTIDMTGNVRFETGGGLYIESDKFIFHYNGLLRSDSEVKLGSENAEGRADHFSYNIETESVVLSGDIDIKVFPEETGEAPIILTTMTLKYDVQSGKFNSVSEFLIEKGIEYLKGGKLNGEMLKGEKSLKELSAEDKAKLCYKGLSRTNQTSNDKDNKKMLSMDGLKTISSPLITFEFDERGRNELQGIKTVAPSVLKVYRDDNIETPPDTIITANEFIQKMPVQEEINQSFTARGKVIIRQDISNSKQQKAERVIKCGVLDASGSGEKEEYNLIKFRKKFSLAQDGNTMMSSEADYDANGGTLEMRGKPVLHMPEGTSAAVTIRYNLKDEILHLKDRVVTKLKNMQERGRVFNETDELFINSDEMRYSSTKRSSIYKNNVKAYQDKSHLFCDELEIMHDSNSFIATGSANGKVFREAGAEKGQEAKPFSFRGDSVTIDEKNTKMILEKRAEVQGAESEEINAEYIEYSFGEDFNEARSVLAREKVSFAYTPYTGTSDYLFFDYPKDEMTLRGDKVMLYRQGKIAAIARELTFSPSGDIIQSRSIPGQRIKALWKVEDKEKQKSNSEKKKNPTGEKSKRAKNDKKK